MTVAQEALHYVFKLHAGFLQSYEIDERKRMLKSSQIVQEAEDGFHEFMDTVQHRHPREALALIEADALPRIQKTVELLLRLAPNYVEKTLQRIPPDMAAAVDAISAFREEIDIRMGKTQYDRVLEVLRMIGQFYESPTEPPYTVMANFAKRIKYILPDIKSKYLAETEQDDGHFIHETWRLLNSKMYKVDTRYYEDLNHKECTKMKKKRKRKCKKGFLDRLD
jgi:hypothetical protein